MIRRSTAIASVAILLSLLVHIFGLTVTAPDERERPAENATPEAMALGSAFEDVAEAQSEPVPPEPVQELEPPVETTPEPELDETPTSEALVASDDPQRVFAPDSGTSALVQPPETTGPSETDEGESPTPETIEPIGGDDGTLDDVPVPSTVEPDTVAQAPTGSPEMATEPAEADASEPVSGSPAAPVNARETPEQFAALPAPVSPVTPDPTPSAVPVIPLQSEAVEPETQDTPIEPAPEDPANENVEDQSGDSGLAVTSSRRPQLPNRPPSEEPVGQSDGSTEFSELLNPPLIESPLAAYQRGRSDLTVRQSGRVQSGGIGFTDSRGPGNSDVTNYAGQVLMHLNRAPAVRARGRGAARIFIEINPDGTLARVDILDRTGSEGIEASAIAQVRAAAPFPRPPQGNIRRLTFTYRIN